MAKAKFPLKKRIELVEQCFEFVKTGQSVCKFADLIGIPRTTLYGWLKRYPRMSARDNRNSNKTTMVPITRHSSSLPPIAPCKLELPSPKTRKTNLDKAISIDLGYCKVEIPQGCDSTTITSLFKDIRGAQ